MRPRTRKQGGIGKPEDGSFGKVYLQPRTADLRDSVQSDDSDYSIIDLANQVGAFRQIHRLKDLDLRGGEIKIRYSGFGQLIYCDPTLRSNARETRFLARVLTRIFSWGQVGHQVALF